jgi:hypothetical protein
VARRTESSGVVGTRRFARAIRTLLISGLLCDLLKTVKIFAEAKALAAGAAVRVRCEIENQEFRIENSDTIPNSEFTIPDFATGA